MKLIFWDGTGLCLFAKRLEGGKFRWPRIEDGCDAAVGGVIGGVDRGPGLDGACGRVACLRRKLCSSLR